MAFEVVEELASLAEENVRVATLEHRVDVLNIDSTKAVAVTHRDAEPSTTAAAAAAAASGGEWNVSMDVDDGMQTVRVLDYTSPRADCVVSELLDTAVIGEGVLPSLRHAAEVLLAPNYRCVPAGATAGSIHSLIVMY